MLGSVLTLERQSDKPRPGSKELSYIAAMAVGVVGSFGAILLIFWILQGLGRLPPPAIANNICIDEKLAYMRDSPIHSPNLLVLGSSVAWRNIDGETLASVIDGVKPANGAFCGLRMHQAEFVGRWLLDRTPSVRTVAVIVSPFDFVGCKVNPTQVFNREAADDFVYGHTWKWWFYFRYFDPVSMARNVLSVASMRRATKTLNAMTFTRYWDGPLDTADSMPTLVYERLPALDSMCLNSLRRLATRLSHEGRRLVVIATPVHPQWKEKYDRDGRVFDAFDAAVQEATAGTGAIYWDGETQFPMPASAFTDAIHMRWSAVRKFSRAAAVAFQSSIAAEKEPGRLGHIAASRSESFSVDP
jgi:hypothetical protein